MNAQWQRKNRSSSPKLLDCYINFILPFIFTINLFLDSWVFMFNSRKLLVALIPRWVDLEKKINGTFVKHEDVNFFHQLALTLLSILLSNVIYFLLKSGMQSINLGDLFRLYSLWLTTVGTIWIAAGVIYKPISIDQEFENFRTHVVETFKTASRHCLVGIGAIFFGFVCQIIADADIVKETDQTLSQYNCHVWLYKEKEAGEAKNIKCTVIPK